MHHHRQSGFTIVELMVGLAVAMIVLGMGVPNFRSLIQNNATATEVNYLATALHLARSEAVGRGVEVMLAPLTAGNWSNGWVVGIDSDNDNVFPESGEPVLRSFPAVEQISFSGAPARVEFRPTGEAGALATFTLLPAHCNNAANRQRVLSVAMAGYVDLTRQACP
ncbi:MAG: GspH/FimT family pseudopilin [Gammaproteobacteria bacterium]